MYWSKKLLILFLAVGFLFGHLSRFLWPGSLLGHLNLLDLAVALALLWYVLSQKRWPQVNHWLLLWLIISLASFWFGLSIFGLTTMPESWLILLRLVVYGLFFGIAGSLFTDASRFVTALGVTISLIGFGQLMIWPSVPVSFIAKYGFDPHNHRLLATFFDPNLLASLLLITTVVTGYRLYQKSRAIDWLALLIQLAALFLTGSRSGWLAFLVAAVLFILATNKRYLLLLVSAAMFVFLFSPSMASRIRSAIDLDETSRARIASWQTASLIIAEEPVNGVGYDNYAAAAAKLGRYYPRVGQIALSANGSDSSWLTVWATTGIFGLLAFGAFLLSLIWTAKTNLGRALILALTGGLLINAWFINSLLWVFVWFLLAIVVGMIQTKSNHAT